MKAIDETMIIKSKFDGVAIGLRYRSDNLVAAFTRAGRDVTEAARTICNLSVELPQILSLIFHIPLLFM